MILALALLLSSSLTARTGRLDKVMNPLRFIVAIAATLITVVVLPGSAYTEERLVLLSCTISDETVQKLVDGSTNVPPPDKEEVIELFATQGRYEIEASFYADSEVVGTGTLLGHTMPYFITEQYVTYMTADNEGLQNSVLNRYSGTLHLTIGGGAFFTYSCEQKGRKY